MDPARFDAWTRSVLGCTDATPTSRRHGHALGLRGPAPPGRRPTRDEPGLSWVLGLPGVHGRRDRLLHRRGLSRSRRQRGLLRRLELLRQRLLPHWPGLRHRRQPQRLCGLRRRMSGGPGPVRDGLLRHRPGVRRRQHVCDTVQRDPLRRELLPPSSTLLRRRGVYAADQVCSGNSCLATCPTGTSPGGPNRICLLGCPPGRIRDPTTCTCTCANRRQPCGTICCPAGQECSFNGGEFMGPVCCPRGMSCGLRCAGRGGLHLFICCNPDFNLQCDIRTQTCCGGQRCCARQTHVCCGGRVCCAKQTQRCVNGTCVPR